MKKLSIVCPSYKRAGKVITNELIDDLIFVVDSSEYEKYKEHYPENEIVTQPLGVKGITKTRQFILDYFDDVFMIDDDLYEVRKQFIGQGNINCNKEEIKDVIHQTHDIAVQMNAKMFGFKNNSNPLFYHSGDPIKHTGYLNASYCGFIKGHGLKYDLNMNEAEDHYISCMNVYKNRYMFIETRYAFITKENFKAEGGCNAYRTAKGMIDATKYLRGKFGDVVHEKKATNHKKNVNIGERTITFPF
jgi:hypothetical protein